jgi:type IV pilus assembly protein PilY1
MNVKKILAWFLISSLVYGGYLPAARADDGDIFGSNISPNVMIVLDTSGSMSDDAGTFVAYNPNTTYSTPLTYTTTTVYQQFTKNKDCKPASPPCYIFYKSSISAVNNPAAQTALSTTGYFSGKVSGSNVDLFYGNYLNYVNCSSCDGIEPKIVIAQRVIANIVNSVHGVNFGVMRFVNNGNQTSPAGSGGVVAEMGSTANTIIAAVNNISVSGWTPLGEQMDDVDRYFKHQTLRNGTNHPAPIQYSCQPNFAIVISDGLWNGNIDPQTVATTLYTSDHYGTTSDGIQNVIVDTVGFSIAASEQVQATAVLQTMAKNGGGTFYTANNYVQLEQALQAAISQILAATFSFATPTIPSTGTNGASKAYLASFQSNPTRPFWKGYLKAYSLVNGAIPVDTTTKLPSGTPVWDAGQQLSLKSASSRTIKTYASGSMQNFVTTNTAITASMLGAADSTEKDQIINYTRGAVDYNDEDSDSITNEERPWKLGDIFHSTPVLVSPPFSPFISDSSYITFKTANASRTSVLMAGANDGMLHAFRESDGQELWAFIPPNLLDQLKNIKALTGVRDFYVDSSPIAADVKIGGAWKTIVVFGERRGGNNYYALDITDTTNPQYLWTFSDTKLGETWSEPAIGKVKMSDGTDKWIAFFGGGFDTTQGNYGGTVKTTEAFFAIDLSNGSKLWEYSNTGTGDSQYMNFSLPAAPTAVDLNHDGYIDRVYIGDVGGQLWKFNVAPTGGATLSGSLISNWTGKRLFAAVLPPTQSNPPPSGEFYAPQAIYSWPTLAFDNNRNLWLFFGTGDRYHPNSATSNRFYAIKDTDTYLTESSLTDMSNGGTPVITQGWYLKFPPAAPSPPSGEKVLAAAEVFNNIVIFTTFTPISATAPASCGNGGGNAKTYTANMTTGDAAIDFVTNTVLTAGQSALSNALLIGTGIPSKPVIVTQQTSSQIIDGQLVLQETTGVVVSMTSSQIWDGGGLGGPARALVAWREVLQ